MDLGRFLKRQACHADARLSDSRQSRTAAAEVAAAEVAAAAEEEVARRRWRQVLAEASLSAQNARRTDEMRHSLQRGVSQIGTWIGALIEGVALPVAGARQLAGE